MTGGAVSAGRSPADVRWSFHFWTWQGAQRVRPHIFSFMSMEGQRKLCPYCFKHCEIFPSLWFIRRTLWHASDFTLPAIFAKASMWQLSADSGAPWVCLQRWQRCPWHQLEIILLQFGSLQIAAEPLACAPCCKMPPEREWVCRKLGRQVTGGKERELHERCLSWDRIHFKHTFHCSQPPRARHWKPTQGALWSAFSVTQSIGFLSGMSSCLMRRYYS